MKGINQKEVLLAAGTTVIGFGTVIIQTKLVEGVIMIAVGTALFFLRGFLKK